MIRFVWDALCKYSVRKQAFVCLPSTEGRPVTDWLPCGGIGRRDVKIHESGLGRETPFMVRAAKTGDMLRPVLWEVAIAGSNPAKATANKQLQTERHSVQTIEYRTVDKSTSPRGPWDNEPDKRQWMDDATGFPCLIVRGPLGALCGYVGVSREHPLYEVKVDIDGEWPLQPLQIHGGITFTGHCRTGDECQSICHRVDEAEDDNVWWLGFDCCHSGDLFPKCDSVLYELFSQHDSYRDIAYVMHEVKDLAQQLKLYNATE